MTHYTENTGSVRVDLFKPSGKWYMTVEMNMTDYYSEGFYPGDGVKKMIQDNNPQWFDNFIIVVPNPFSAWGEYPVLINKVKNGQ